MKSKKIDKTHWIIQFSTLFLVTLIFLLAPKILDLTTIFPKNNINNLALIPTSLSIFLVFLAMFLKRKPKRFSKEWLFNDFTYWNIFSLVLSLIAIFHFCKMDMVYGIFTQIFAYIALLLGYANELRNGMVKKKKGKKK